MRKGLLPSLLVCAGLAGALAEALQPVAPAQIPEKMPLDLPCGTTINLARALQVTPRGA